MYRKRHALVVIAGLTLQCVALGASAAAPPAVVVAEDLLSPRGLDFAPNGQLYVTESGVIKTPPADISTDPSCVPGYRGPQCYTETGAITLIDPAGIQPPKRIITGLPTLDDAGPADVSFLGMKGHVALGLGANPAVRSTLLLADNAKANLLGTAISFNPNASGKYNVVADISALETSNPDGYTGPGSIDSNPFGILALPGRTIVADAGGNDLFEVKANGSTRLLAVFPTNPASPATGPQRVPSRVTLGPDGYLYVADEAFSSGPGGARIYRVPPDGCQPVNQCPVYVTGVWTVMDLQFDHGGNLYFVEYLSGTLWKIDTSGLKTPVYTGLRQPGGLALSNDAAYVSNKGVCYGVANSFGCADGEYGEVLRIPLNN